MRQKRYPLVLSRLVGEAIARTGIAAAAEIGVARGETSALLLRNHPGLLLWLVDPWLHDPKYMALLGLHSNKILPNQAAWDRVYDQALANTEFAAERRRVLRVGSLEAAPRLADNSLALVFIDGVHSYEAVQADAMAWWPKLVLGGTLAGDDYCIGKVRKAAERWAASIGVGPLRTDDKVWWAVKPIA